METVIVNGNEIELGDWLEDTDDGLFSRYATGAEDSVWRCNNCGQVEGVDAHEGYCPSCSGDQ